MSFYIDDKGRRRRINTAPITEVESTTPLPKPGDAPKVAGDAVLGEPSTGRPRGSLYDRVVDEVVALAAAKPDAWAKVDLSGRPLATVRQGILKVSRTRETAVTTRTVDGVLYVKHIQD